MTPAEKRKAARAHDAPMKILAYVGSVQDDPPESLRCCARILMGDGELHPVVFHGPTKQAVRDAAQSWWDAEIERARQTEENRAKAAANIAAGREARKPKPQAEAVPA